MVGHDGVLARDGHFHGGLAHGVGLLEVRPEAMWRAERCR
jgi:hypothetical protein